MQECDARENDVSREGIIIQQIQAGSSSGTELVGSTESKNNNKSSEKVRIVRRMEQSKPLSNVKIVLCPLHYNHHSIHHEY